MVVNNLSSFIPSIKVNKESIKSIQLEIQQSDSIYKNDLLLIV